MTLSLRKTIFTQPFKGFLFIVLLLSTSVNAVVEEVAFDSPALEARYYDLIAELRCLVCQNQNLADSDADLAKDLRRKTLEMLEAGQSDQQILEYMRERYGDFVLYSPPLNASTALLWLGPFLLLIGAAFAILFNIKRRQSSAEPASEKSTSQAELARELMNEMPNLADTTTPIKDQE